LLKIKLMISALSHEIGWQQPLQNYTFCVWLDKNRNLIKLSVSFIAFIIVINL